jgi:hypothetical protein
MRSELSSIEHIFPEFLAGANLYLYRWVCGRVGDAPRQRHVPRDVR